MAELIDPFDSEEPIQKATGQTAEGAGLIDPFDEPPPVAQAPEPVPAQAPAVQQPMTMADRVRRKLAQMSPYAESALQGVSLGWSDEVEAGILAGIEYAKGAFSGSPADLGEIYGQQLEGLQRNYKQFREQSPGVALAGEIGGGLLTGGIGAMRSAAASGAKSGLSAVAHGAGTGAIYGGVAGAGYSEPGGMNRLEGAAKGAAIGGAVGGALPAVIGGAKRGAGAIMNRVTKPETAAKRKLAEAIGRDDMTTDQVRQRLTDLGPEATLADAGGENVLGLSRAVTAVPGPAKNQASRVLTARQLGRNERVTGVIRESLGDGAEFHSTLQRIADERSAAASPLYQKALAKKANISSVVKQLDDRIPQTKGRISSSLKRARSLLTKEDGSPETSMEVLHNAKMEIDDLIETSKRQGRGNAVRELMKTKNALLKSMDDASEDYRQARSIFASEKDNEAALEAGRKFLSGDSELTSKELRAMTGSEKEYFRVGAARALRDKILGAPDGADAYKRLFGNDLLREKLRAVMPDEKTFKDFEKTMQAEATFNRTRNATLGGSPTARIEAEKVDLGVDPGVLEEAVSGRPVSAAINLVRSVLAKTNVPPERMRQELGELLFSGDPQTNQRVLEELSRNRSLLSPTQRQILADTIIAGAAEQGGRLAAP